jgi:hypothetical protein
MTGAILATWVDNGTTEPYYAIYSGSSWSPAAPISSTPTTVITFGDVYTCFNPSTNQFFAAWTDASNNNYPTYSIYDVSSATWGMIATISTLSQVTFDVTLSSDSSTATVLATWQDSNTSDPFYSFYDGSTWSTPSAITSLAAVGFGGIVFSCFDPSTNQFFSTWGNITAGFPFYPAYAIYSLNSLSTPSGLAGVQKVNDFGIVKERFNTLSWQSNTEVTAYYLYRNGALIAVLDGAADSYNDHDQPKKNQLYSLVAVNSSGSSTPALLIVGGR